jgi:hypothetical protein
VRTRENLTPDEVDKLTVPSAGSGARAAAMQR